jgi:DNA-binding CsgD family transcriptional regulator
VVAQVLTREQVCLARERAACGHSTRRIARELEKNERTLRYAIRGATYKSITDPPPVSDTQQSAALVLARYPEVADYFYEGRSSWEIAKLTGVAPSTVRNLCQRLEANMPPVATTTG